VVEEKREGDRFHNIPEDCMFVGGKVLVPKVRSFLGSLGYHRSLIIGFAKKTARLRGATKKTNPCWTIEMEKEFRSLIQTISSEPFMSNYDALLPTVIETDWCKDGYGVVLY